MKPLKILCLGFIFCLLLFLFSFSPISSFAQECGQQAPSDAPNLYQVSMSSSSATLYFAQPTSQFDGYSIFYGLTPSADAYSVSFKMGVLNGAVKYTVNDLFPKTNYYFKVRATNGCAAGPFSSTVSTNIKGAGNLPETGPSNTFLTIGVGGLALMFVGIMSFIFLF